MRRGVIKAEVPFIIKFRLRRKDGIYRLFKTNAIPIRDNKEKLIKWYGTNIEITEDASNPGEKNDKE
ncbi:MAG: PAS domain-containing protein [Oligoflexia bacterium]|nr:PAS domain-containing protein [Oligoflexia bacterium]